LSLNKFNIFSLFNLPSAYFAGVRVVALDATRCQTTVKLNWFTKNPFRSMFWAIHGMAAELATGIPMTIAIRESNKKISMLVLNNKANFSKKATGRIHFQCDQRKAIEETVKKAIETRQPQTIWVTSIGKDAQGDIVSTFEFEWTLKAK